MKPGEYSRVRASAYAALLACRWAQVGLMP